MEYPSPQELVLKHGTHTVISAFRRAAKLNVAGSDRTRIKAVLMQIAILQLMRQRAVQFASLSAKSHLATGDTAHLGSGPEGECQGRKVLEPGLEESGPEL